MGLSLRQIEELLGLLLTGRRTSPIIRPWGIGCRPRPHAPGRSWRSSTRCMPPGFRPSPLTRSFLGATHLGGS
jgi:hypothetical protein